MEKFVSSRNYAVFLEHLRSARKAAGLTQQELAERLRETQTFVSKCERGDRRIDISELYEFCQALNISLSQFVRTLEEEIMTRDGA